MRHLHTAQRHRCAALRSDRLNAGCARWNGPERFIDVNEFLSNTRDILESQVSCGLALTDEECSIQDVARMCFLLQRWRGHCDLIRAIEETFPAAGVDPITSSLAQLQDPAIAKALRSFVSSELEVFSDQAKLAETSAMGCIT